MGLLNSGLFDAFKPGQGITPKPDPSFLQQLGSGLSSPMFQGGVQMMQTGEPPLTPMMPPQPGSANALQGAFGGNPQFQKQLQALMSGQGPGMQGPQMTMPPMQVNTAASQSDGAPQRGRFPFLGRYKIY